MWTCDRDYPGGVKPRDDDSRVYGVCGDQASEVTGVADVPLGGISRLSTSRRATVLPGK